MNKKAILIPIAIAAGLAVPGIIAAHHPVLSSNVARPCGSTAPWTGAFIVQADEVRGKQWQNRYVVAATVQTPTGAYSDLIADASPFGPIPVGPFAATTASVVVTVQSKWAAQGNDPAVGPIQRNITLTRPVVTECPVESTTTAPTTTTVAATTTTIAATTTTLSAPPSTTSQGSVPTTVAPTPAPCDTTATSASCFPPVPTTAPVAPTLADISVLTPANPPLPATGAGDTILILACIIVGAGIIAYLVSKGRRVP